LRRWCIPLRTLACSPRPRNIRRSANAHGADLRLPRYGKGTSQQYLEETNARTVSFAMIETRAALEVLDGILATLGIDAIFLGPSDFSIA
jgi:4-hydroxy-2-oxoheptanedioate aldolase